MSNSKIRLMVTWSCFKQENNGVYTPNNAVNLYIVYEIDRWLQDLIVTFTLKDCLFGNVKLTKNANFSYSGYGIRFDPHSVFSIPDFDWGKNVVIFGVDMSSSVDANNKNKDILILGKGQTQGLDNTKLTAEQNILVIFKDQKEHFV